MTGVQACALPILWWYRMGPAIQLPMTGPSTRTELPQEEESREAGMKGVGSWSNGRHTGLGDLRTERGERETERKERSDSAGWGAGELRRRMKIETYTLLPENGPTGTNYLTRRILFSPRASQLPTLPRNVIDQDLGCRSTIASSESQ